MQQREEQVIDQDMGTSTPRGGGGQEVRPEVGGKNMLVLDVSSLFHSRMKRKNLPMMTSQTRLLQNLFTMKPTIHLPQSLKRLTSSLLIQGLNTSIPFLKLSRRPTVWTICTGLPKSGSTPQLTLVPDSGKTSCVTVGIIVYWCVQNKGTLIFAQGRILNPVSKDSSHTQFECILCFANDIYF